MWKLKLGMLALLLSLCLTGCRKEEQEAGYSMYYINKDETKVVRTACELAGTTPEEQVQEMLDKLSEVPAEVEYRSVLPETVDIQSYYLDNGQLYLYFNNKYLEMAKPFEVLCRAAIVKNFCQLPGVDYVIFYIDSQPLSDSEGRPLGLMNSSDFIENPGEESSAVKTVTLDLYFANQAGDKLVKQSEKVEYKSNMSLEKLVIESLIAGPKTTGVYPTIPAETKLLSVTNKDGICYVNLDEGFLSQGYDVLESIPIYSITNSLLELPGITKVQLLINGETDIKFQESITLNTPFERNLDLVQEEKVTLEEDAVKDKNAKEKNGKETRLITEKNE